MTGKAPYGYRWDKTAQAGLAVDEQQASVDKKIFELYVHEGYSIRQIIAWLKDNHIPSHSGNPVWGSTPVNRMLKNPTYIGKAYYNKTKYLPNYQREDRDQSEWIEIPTTQSLRNGYSWKRRKDSQKTWNASAGCLPGSIC